MSPDWDVLSSGFELIFLLPFSFNSRTLSMFLTISSGESGLDDELAVLLLAWYGEVFVSFNGDTSAWWTKVCC
jgi:hypothetical protein